MSSGLELDLELKQANKTYSTDGNDSIAGKLVIRSKNDFRHEGIFLSLDGTVTTVAGGIKGAPTGPAKVTPLVSYSGQIVRPDDDDKGKMAAGLSEIFFDVPLKSISSRTPLLETYHGVRINVEYVVKCEVKRGVLTQNASKSVEILVQKPKTKATEAEKSSPPYEFTITPNSLKNVSAGQASRVPNFSIRGHLSRTRCPLDQPITGEITIDDSGEPIKSVDVQLLRVEQVEDRDRYSSEIQNIQLADGNVPKKLAIPIHMVLPRLFCCASVPEPTKAAGDFRLGFEVNIMVVFKNDYVVAENIPVVLQHFV